MNLMQSILWLLSVIVAAFVGGFLKSYMGKKGENVATREDLKHLIVQVEKVTRTQEEIKQEISGKNRLWELKREVAYDVMKTTGVIGHLFVMINGVYNSSRESELTPQRRSKLQDDLKDSEATFKESLERLWGLEGTSHLVFDETVVGIVRKLINSSVALLAAASSPFETDRIKSTDAFGRDRGEANLAFRNELKQ